MRKLNYVIKAQWEIREAKISNNWPEKGDIEFKNFSLKYRKDLDFALKNINLKISSGEKIGIVGRTGAGKSSLALSLFRMLESNYGLITIDDVDIKTVGLHHLRNNLTIIPQVNLN
jgi:ATP-binding cassette, subfamily C (CFTR/MRP), member 1